MTAFEYWLSDNESLLREEYDLDNEGFDDFHDYCVDFYQKVFGKYSFDR